MSDTTGTPEDAEAAWEAYSKGKVAPPEWWKQLEVGFLAGFAARPSVTVDEITELLAGHRETKTEATRNGCRCECGEPICTDLGGMSHDWHYREHLASVIVAHITGEGT